MKIPSQCDRFWMMLDGNVATLGFSNAFLDEIGVIWNFIPKTYKQVDEGQIFGNLESSKRLAPIYSPLTGKIVGWNETFLLHPDKITGEDWIIKIEVKENTNQ